MRSCVSFSCPRHLRMKLNKEKLHGAGYIGKWLSLLLRFGLCVHVWLVFFCTVFILWSRYDVTTQNVAHFLNKRKKICLYWHWVTSKSWHINLLTLRHHWSKSGPIGLSIALVVCIAGGVLTSLQVKILNLITFCFLVSLYYLFLLLYLC